MSTQEYDAIIRRSTSTAFLVLTKVKILNFKHLTLLGFYLAEFYCFTYFNYITYTHKT